MRDLFWLSEEQLARIEPFFPLAHGVPRVDDRKVISGIIFVIKNGLRWRMPRRNTGLTKPCTTGSNAGVKMGVFDKIFSHLSTKGDPPDTFMIDATHLKAHRTASSLLKKGMFPAASGAPKAG